MNNNNLITQEIDIPSIVIDKSFLEQLGKIVENQQNEEESEEKNSIGINYKIKINNKVLEFKNIKNLLESDFSLNNIKEFSLYSHNDNNQYVDINMRINAPMRIFFKTMMNNCSLSSTNEASILKVERKINDLFDEYRINYHNFFYPKSEYSHIFTFILSALISIIICTKLLEISIFRPYIMVMFLIAYYYVAGNIITYIFPYYEFKLSKKDSLKNLLRYLFYTIVITYIAESIYTLLK